MVRLNKGKEDGNRDSVLMVCKLKVRYPQDRALGIGNLKQQIWGKEMVGNLEGGRIIFWHDWNNFCPSLITTVSVPNYFFPLQNSVPSDTHRCFPLSAMAFIKQWMQLANSHPLNLIFWLLAYWNGTEERRRNEGETVSYSPDLFLHHSNRWPDLEVRNNYLKPWDGLVGLNKQSSLPWGTACRVQEIGRRCHSPINLSVKTQCGIVHLMS